MSTSLLLQLFGLVLAISRVQATFGGCFIPPCPLVGMPSCEIGYEKGNVLFAMPFARVVMQCSERPDRVNAHSISELAVCTRQTFQPTSDHQETEKTLKVAGWSLTRHALHI